MFPAGLRVRGWVSKHTTAQAPGAENGQTKAATTARGWLLRALFNLESEQTKQNLTVFPALTSEGLTGHISLCPTFNRYQRPIHSEKKRRLETGSRKECCAPVSFHEILLAMQGGTNDIFAYKKGKQPSSISDMLFPSVWKTPL